MALSLVLAGANPGAFIDCVMTHADTDEAEALIVGYDENIVIYHSDELDDDVIEHACGSNDKKKKKEIEHAANSEENKEGEKMADNKEKTVADVFDELAGIEFARIDEVSAVAEDDADDGFDEQSYEDIEHDGDLCVADVRILILHIQLAECRKLFKLLHECLYDSEARKALLREVGEIGECLLTDIPALSHGLADDGTDDKHERHGYEGKAREHLIHLPHLAQCEYAEEKSVNEHQYAVAHAFLNGVKIVGEKAHEVADLVHLIVLVGQKASVLKHPVAQIGLDLDSGAEEAYPP